MAYLLALGSAALYGAADFLGGLASRTASTIAIVVLSQAAGLVLVCGLLLFLPASPSTADFAWGAASGLAGGIGVALLYRALAVGTMSLVAPTTAVCAVLIPVGFDAFMGQRLAGQELIGIVLALIAVVLVGQASRAGEDERGTKGLGLALLSGLAIGLFFLALARTSATAGLWPLVSARVTSVSLFAVIALAGSHSLRMSRPAVRVSLACGALDMAANALYLLATRGGALSVIVTLSSLYPASTVVLARFVLGERLNVRQALGIVSALAAVVLIVSAR